MKDNPNGLKYGKIPLVVDGSVLAAAGVEVLVVLVESVEIEAESTPSGSESEQVSQVQSLPSSSEVTEHCLIIAQGS